LETLLQGSGTLLKGTMMVVKTKIESLGVYVPSHVMTTEEVMSSCHRRPRWDLEKLTGIQERHVAKGEYAVDLSIKAAQRALSMSQYCAEDLDMIICTSISKYDQKDRLLFEPSTSIRIRKEIGASRSTVFDLVNACAGMFSGIYAMDSFIRAGVVKRGMVVSGEYITPIAENARREIRHSFDGQMASLTVGDCGAALILDSTTDTRYGFHSIEMVTGAKYCDLCIGRPSFQGPGPVMHTKPVRLHQKSMEHGFHYFKKVIDQSGWNMEDITWVIPHQTSSRAIKKAAKTLREDMGCDVRFLINVEKYGNTSSTTHSLAMHEYILRNEIQQNHNILFAVGASGIVLGDAAYTMDDLPDRYRVHFQRKERECKEVGLKV
jgi:3-oxoacyl-[acyl-carrier-protein] synthase III